MGISEKATWKPSLILLSLAGSLLLCLNLKKKNSPDTRLCRLLFQELVLEEEDSWS